VHKLKTPDCDNPPRSGAIHYYSALFHNYTGVFHDCLCERYCYTNGKPPHREVLAYSEHRNDSISPQRGIHPVHSVSVSDIQILPTRSHPQTPVVSEPGKAKGELTTAASRTSESALRVEVSVFCNFKTNPHFGDISCARTPRAQALRSCRAPCPPTRNSQTAAADGPSCPQPSSYPKCR